MLASVSAEVARGLPFSCSCNNSCACSCRLVAELAMMVLALLVHPAVTAPLSPSRLAKPKQYLPKQA